MFRVRRESMKLYRNPWEREGLIRKTLGGSWDMVNLFNTFMAKWDNPRLNHQDYNMTNEFKLLVKF